MGVHYLLDISRLLDRAGASGPTGIDRVELAYAEYLISNKSDRVLFCAWHWWGRIGGIKSTTATAFIRALSERWKDSNGAERTALLKRRIRRQLFWRKVPKRPKTIYLLLSHHHLMRQSSIDRFLKASSAYFVAMIHDIIPVSFPEYSRAREEKRHQRRLVTVASLADGIIVPSDAVKADLRSFLPNAGVPIWSVPHGVFRRASSNLHHHSLVPKRPYFVYLSTIEPRKNHLLLFHAWRKMIEISPERAPTLVLIGKRGWENENIIDLLERSHTLRPYLIEYNKLSDEQVGCLLESSQALLFPSFTEGFGLPVAEALSFGVPVICSDIPVLREVGGNVAEYIDPLNGSAWADIILDYTVDGPRRRAQLEKIKDWQPFSWDESVARALEALGQFFRLQGEHEKRIEMKNALT